MTRKACTNAIFAYLHESKKKKKFQLFWCLARLLQVSKLGFGCAGLSGLYSAPLSHEAGCSVIKEAFNRGITFFDTSDIYGDEHDNEIMVGKVNFFLLNI